MRFLLFVIGAAVAGASLAEAGQAAKPGADAVVIAQARKAAAAGRADEALRLIDPLLAKNAANRDAVEVKIGIQASGGETAAALDTYDAYAKAASHDRRLLAIVARATLSSLAADASPFIRIAALERLAAEGQPAAREALTKARTAADDSESTMATHALARLGDPTALAPLLQATRVGMAGSRRAALQSLAKISSPDVTAAVKAALNDPDPFIRASAAEVAGVQKMPGTTEALKAAIAVHHPILRLAAAAALIRMGEPEGRALAVEMLATPLHDVRLMMAAPLASVGDTSWVPAIRPVLEDPVTLNRIMAAELMLKVEPKTATELLSSAANDPNPIIRAEVGRIVAASAAGNAALPALRKLLGDASAQVRLQVATGMTPSRPVK